VIDLYYWPTPNGHKISIMLEECGLDYQTIPVDIGAGDQFAPEFLKISPNNRMPAIVDRETGISVFEGGAILIYLAEKNGCLLPSDPAARFDVLQWLFWQAGGLGPMAGQLSHFKSYLEKPVPYAETRYGNEYDRLLAVMDEKLKAGEFLAGDYSIADIAAFPWVRPYRRLGNDVARFPHLKRWYETLKARPAVRRGIDLGSDWKRTEATDTEAKALLFNQNAETIRRSRKGHSDEIL
jgi:GST-like protein